MYIPRSKCIDIIREIGVSAGLPASEMLILTKMVESVPFVEIDGAECCRRPEVVSFAKNFRDAVRHKDAGFLHRKRGLRFPIVDIEEFCESDKFYNQKGHIRPAVKQKLMEAFVQGNPYIEIILGGSIGWGKSYFTDMSMAYMLYNLSCYHDPQLEFGLAPGSSIVFVMQSKNERLAKKVVFDQFAARISRSPYFSKFFPYDKQVKSELRFPNQISILPVGGGETAAMGMNVWCAAIDEMNFMTRTSDSMMIKYSHEDEYDQAQVLYNTLIKRMKSRFIEFGKIPGKLILISSTNYDGDFISRKIEEARTDPAMFAVEFAQWETIPQERFLGGKFLVEVGNARKRTRVLDSMLEAQDETDVVEVPIEYKKEFLSDPDGAMRDLGGKASLMRNPFIPFREQIEKAFVEHEKITGGRNLFRHSVADITKLTDMDRPDFSEIIDLEYIRECVMDPSQVFAVHVDPAVTHDKYGLAVGRIIGYVMSTISGPSYDMSPHDAEVAEMWVRITRGQPVRLPIVMIDGLMGVMAPPNDEIHLDFCRDMIIWLKSKINIVWGTADTHQSASVFQGWRRAGIRSGPLSVENITPYLDLKQMIRDGRIYLPRVSLLAKELRELQRDKSGNKVDHQINGSKDMADSVCGVAHILFRKEAIKALRGAPQVSKTKRTGRIARRLK